MRSVQKLRHPMFKVIKYLTNVFIFSAKCVQRINDIIELEKVLQFYLDAIPDVPLSDFVLAEVSFSNERAQATKNSFSLQKVVVVESEDENEEQNAKVSTLPNNDPFINYL